MIVVEGDDVRGLRDAGLSFLSCEWRGRVLCGGTDGGEARTRWSQELAFLTVAEGDAVTQNVW